MNETFEWLLRAVLIGAGATFVMDLWGIFLKYAFKVPSLGYALVGRWIGHFPRGRFAHDNIATSPPIRGESVIGWSAHYAIGVLFAMLLLVLFGLDWARQPTPPPALFVGVATVAAPFFIMQPGLGLGIAASKTPKPSVARARSLMNHAVFGIGLYVAAVLIARLVPASLH